MKLIGQILCFAFVFGTTHGDSVPTIELSNGHKMPMIGLGTFLNRGESAEKAVTFALENGYRHIDTAFLYQNEKDVGRALKKWLAKGNKREDLFITTKLPPIAMRPSDVSKAIDRSLSALGLRYVDMYLVHVPFGIYRTHDFHSVVYSNGSLALDYNTNHVAIWKEMEKLVKAGKVRSIGLSNFNMTQIMNVWNNAEIKPTGYQMELNAYIQQNKLVKLCEKLKIVVTAYSPLGTPSVKHIRRKRQTGSLPELIDHPLIKELATKYHKTPAQIILRHNHQRNIVVIPKSKTPSRIEENFEIFDFTIRKPDMRRLSALDKQLKYRKFDFRTFKGVRNHPQYPFEEVQY